MTMTAEPVAAPADAVRVIALPDGRRLVVRAARRDDIAALQRLYDELPDDDRYRRFFSLFRPGRRFFEKLVTFEERGGLSLVVEVGADGDVPPQIVAEADYSLLPNGDGEFAITVASAWRGWLGPFLLDALVSEAASRGIRNLEADILTTNAPMLALVRARGFVSMSHPDWTVTRVCIGAATPMPAWPAVEGRTRVLVEVPGARWRAEEAAREAGLQLLACPGPDVSKRCPVLTGGSCPLAETADVIVMVRPRASAGWRQVRESHAARGNVPVCVERAAGLDAEGTFIEIDPSEDAVAVAARLRALAAEGLGSNDSG